MISLADLLSWGCPATVSPELAETVVLSSCWWGWVGLGGSGVTQIQEPATPSPPNKQKKQI